ncbi:MAG: NUDIX domain-containing protein [Bacteroidales bacterium]|nr:NUDIX domain-containing protein [Bacteroidales bacterium]MCF8334208.1 NUDIX domain-containing protein [Bacteroidales bacterium]
MTEATAFNIRVYGIVIEKGHVLLSDEFRLGQRMTKFPGGGLQLGEGTVDCLKREFREELNQPVYSIEHFYTTDFYQVSYLLNPPQQIISIYYTVKIRAPYNFETSRNKFAMKDTEGSQVLRWMPISTLPPG